MDSFEPLMNAEDDPYKKLAAAIVMTAINDFRNAKITLAAIAKFDDAYFDVYFAEGQFLYNKRQDSVSIINECTKFFISEESNINMFCEFDGACIFDILRKEEVNNKAVIDKYNSLRRMLYKKGS